MNMAWRLVTVDQLPLGHRVLRYGCRGNDVRELQKLLLQGGFYFGEVDGYFGVLTEEAVILAEKTFKLRIDGIAGKQVISALRQLTGKSGRTIYTVKKYDSIETISQKFGVAPSAWESIAGQGNPRKKLFPGMKLMLSEKALFAWEDVPSTSPFFSATFHSWAEITSTGQLDCKEVVSEESYHGIGADGEVWEAILTKRSCQRRLIASLKTLPGIKYGLDLRNIPQEWRGLQSKFLSTVLKGLNKGQFDFLVITVVPDLKRLNNRIAFAELAEICSYGRWILAEPPICRDNQDIEAVLKAYWRLLPKLNQATMHRVFPMVVTNGWEWGGAEGRHVSFRECKILRALHYRSARYFPELFLTRVEWTQQGENRKLYYRDNQGWVDYFDYLKRHHFPGTVICRPTPLENTLSQLVPHAFAVMPGSRLKDL